MTNSTKRKKNTLGIKLVRLKVKSMEKDAWANTNEIKAGVKIILITG